MHALNPVSHMTCASLGKVITRKMTTPGTRGGKRRLIALGGKNDIATVIQQQTCRQISLNLALRDHCKNLGESVDISST